MRSSAFRSSSPISIGDLRVIEGDLPRRILALALEWAYEHRAELLEDWEWAAQQKPVRTIAPLVCGVTWCLESFELNIQAEARLRRLLRKTESGTDVDAFCACGARAKPAMNENKYGDPNCVTK